MKNNVAFHVDVNRCTQMQGFCERVFFFVNQRTICDKTQTVCEVMSVSSSLEVASQVVAINNTALRSKDRNLFFFTVCFRLSATRLKQVAECLLGNTLS